MPSTRRKRTQAPTEDDPQGSVPASTLPASLSKQPTKRPRWQQLEQLENVQLQPDPPSEEQHEESSQPSGSAKRKPRIPYPLRHLTPRRSRARIDSLFERSNFSPEQLNAIRDSANKVLLGLLSNLSSTSAGASYKKHLKKWQVISLT